MPVIKHAEEFGQDLGIVAVFIDEVFGEHAVVVFGINGRFKRK